MPLSIDRSMSADSFPDEASPSDSSLDDNGGPNIPTYHIDASNFPRPMPILGPMLGWTDAKFTGWFQKNLQKAATTVKRPLTQDEANALAYHSAKTFAILSYAAPLGVSGGLWRCWGTKDTFRFPFVQPDYANGRFESFPTVKWPALRGVQAVMLWHGLRALSYGYMGSIVSKLLLGSYAASIRAVGELGDRRLTAYTESMKEQMKNKMTEQQQQQQQQEQRMPQPQTRQAPPGFGSGTQDDASPTGMFGQADMPFEADEGVQKPVPPTRQWPMRPQPPQFPVESTEAKPFDLFDDDSPTASQQGMVADTQPVRQQGSAWERIRRGQNPPSPAMNRNQDGQAQQIQREQREGSTVGDGYTFSKADEERSYAKEEAQKDFDARLERERKGGDFNSGSNRKW